MSKKINVIVKILTLIMSLSFVLATTVACTGNDKGQNVGFELKEYYYQLYEGQTRSIETICEKTLKYEYVVGNDQIISVDENGVVTALKEGASVVSVKADGLEKTMLVEVVSNQVTLTLSLSNTNLVLDSNLQLNAKLSERGQESINYVSWELVGNATSVKDGNTITITPTDIGYVTVTASYANLSKTCDIKVVSKTATVLDTPIVSINNCNQIKWDNVENANAYSVFVNGEWVDVIENQYTFNQIDEYKEGEYLNVAVRAIAKNDFNYVDSNVASVTLTHDFTKESVGESYSCTKAGTVKYSCLDCDREYTIENYVDKHNYIDGKCQDCGNIQSPNVIYAYDSELDCYYVAGVQNSDDDELYVLSEYETAVNGKKPVSYVGQSAFSSNTQIRKIVLPESVIGLAGQCFSRMSHLEYLAMPGVQFTGYNNVSYTVNGKTKVFNNARDNWTDTYSLKTIIVAQDFNNAERNFFVHKWSPDGYKPILDVFVYGDNYTALFPGGRPLGMMTVPVGAKNGENYQLTGEVYYYDQTAEKCGHWWHYNKDGEVVKNKEHTIRENVCINCGYIYNPNYFFKYDVTLQAYEVMRVREGKIGEIAIVPSEYNDGIHGLLPVKAVGVSAFTGLTNLKKVVLPDSVVQIKGAAFSACTALETVIMQGVTNFAAQKNAFINCIKLRQVVVGNQLSISEQVFHVQPNVYGNYVARTNLYVNGQEEGKVNASQSGNNNMLTGDVYLYNTDHTYHGTWWKYDSDGNIIETKQPHTYNGNTCSCGAIEPNGIKYAYNGQGYVVKGLLDTTRTVVEIPSRFNDGVNGETDVIAVDQEAFNGYTKAHCKNITKVVLPETVKVLNQRAFMYCHALEMLIAPGVETLVPTASGQYYHFLEDYSLKTVVFSSNLKSIPNNVFYSAKIDGTVNIYLSGNQNNLSGNISEVGNNLLSTNIYVYKEDYVAGKCGMVWRYIDANKTDVIYGTEHVYTNDVCSKCSAIDPKGIDYTFNGDGYTVNGLIDKTLTTIEIPAKFNDGINGLKDVTTIASRAFDASTKKYCDNITKVVLPESVTVLGDRAFMNCTKLTTVIAPGVTTFLPEREGSDSRFQFGGCTNLETLVISATVNVIPVRVLYDATTGVIPKVNVYLDGTGNGLTVRPDNHLYSGNYYYRSTTASANCWDYDSNGMPKLWNV